MGILVRWGPHRMGAFVECYPRWLGPSWGPYRAGALVGGALVEWGLRGVGDLLGWGSS